MAWGRAKPNHNGAKKGKGYWGRKKYAKKVGNRNRRREKVDESE